MLVLTRKVNEKIRIGSDIWITVIRVQGRSVRIGIEAPAEVPIVRAELPLRDRNSPCADRETICSPNTSPTRPSCAAEEDSEEQLPSGPPDPLASGGQGATTDLEVRGCLCLWAGE